ncbi:hypothetical protein CapIbe_000420 [Capra ibex]
MRRGVKYKSQKRWRRAKLSTKIVHSSEVERCNYFADQRPGRQEKNTKKCTKSSYTDLSPFTGLVPAVLLLF